MDKVSFPNDDYYGDDVMEIRPLPGHIDVILDPDAGDLPAVGDWALVTRDGETIIDGYVDETEDGRADSTAPDSYGVRIVQDRSI